MNYIIYPAVAILSLGLGAFLFWGPNRLHNPVLIAIAKTVIWCCLIGMTFLIALLMIALHSQ